MPWVPLLLALSAPAAAADEPLVIRIELPPEACCLYDPEAHVMTCEMQCTSR